MTRQPLYAIALFSLLLCALSFPSAMAFGIAPSREIIDYSTMPQTLTLRILNTEGVATTVTLSEEGALAPYATLSQTELSFAQGETEKPVSYTITLPRSGLPAGTDTLQIKATQQVQGSGTVQVSTAVIYELQVRVPYPGVYAEGSLFVESAEPLKPIIVDVPLYNKGTEEFITDGTFILKETDLRTTREVGSGTFPSTTLSPGAGIKIQGIFEPGLRAGIYDVNATVVYKGNELVMGKQFSVGDIIVSVPKIDVGTFKIGTIAKFDATFSNNWNRPVDSITADTTITNNASVQVGRVTTDAFSLASRGNAVIPLYWDTAGRPAGVYTFDITTHYSGKEHSQSFKAIVTDNGIKVYTIEQYEALQNQKGTSLLRIGGIVLMAVIIVILAFLWWKRRPKHPSKSLFKSPSKSPSKKAARQTTHNVTQPHHKQENGPKESPQHQGLHPGEHSADRDRKP